MGVGLGVDALGVGLGVGLGVDFRHVEKFIALTHGQGARLDDRPRHHEFDELQRHMEHVQPDGLLHDDRRGVEPRLRGDRRLDPSGQEAAGRRKGASDRVEPIDQRCLVGIDERHGGRRLPHQPADPLVVGQQFDVALRGDHDHRRPHEVGPRHGKLPLDATGVLRQWAAGPDFNHRVAGQRLGERDHDLARLRRHRRDIDRAGRADLVDAPGGVDGDGDAAHGGAAGGHAKPGLQGDAAAADVVAILRLDHDAAPPRPHLQRQRRRLGVVGEGGHESLLPHVGRRIDSPQLEVVAPANPPVAIHEKAHAAPLPPGGDALHSESDRLERRAARWIDRPLAGEVHHCEAVVSDVDRKINRGRLVGAATGNHGRGRLHLPQGRPRWEREPDPRRVGREVAQPHDGLGDRVAAVDADDALRHHVGRHTAAVAVLASSADPDSHHAGEPAKRHGAAALLRLGFHRAVGGFGMNADRGSGSRGTDLDSRGNGTRHPQRERLGSGGRVDRNPPLEHGRVPEVAPVFWHGIEPGAISSSRRINIDEHPARPLVPRWR